MDKVIIFDTTLRDGEQGAGSSLNVKEKLEIARQLEKLNVDVIEAGFPASSPGDFEAVQLIAKEVRKPVICALTFAQNQSVDAAWEAVKGAQHPRIHIFLSSSDIHLSNQLKKSRDEILQLSCDMVKHAKKYLDDIEFSPMDATRTDPAYLNKLVAAVIDAGATTVNVPDTVGYTTPGDHTAMVENILQNVSNIKKAILSVHCHNDLGMGVANSLMALKSGARQVECTINGIGERAGNASLEEIVMALEIRKDYFNLETNIVTKELYKTSRLVSELTGLPIPRNKAIVGTNAFRHESGIHQDGVLKKAITYEIMDPRTVGIPSSSLVMGKLSGRHAFREHLAELGYTLKDEDLNRAFAAFKELADKKREVTDRDIESLIAEGMRTISEIYHLEQIQVSCGEPGIPTATVMLIAPDGQTIVDASPGTGPVDAVYKAINRIVKMPNKLTEFTIKSVTEGIDAIGEVLIRIENDSVIYTGRGADTDIIVASAKAYMNALNRLLAVKNKLFQVK